MLEEKNSIRDQDPIDAFYEVLSSVWGKVTWEFDVQAGLPSLTTLFAGLGSFDPCVVAETILRNMITEVTQQVHRFSPWYKLPARAFGLIAFRDVGTHQHSWYLAPEAIMKWQDEIQKIAGEIDTKRGLIQAILVVDDMDLLEQDRQPKIVAVCKCIPPVELLVAREFLDNQEIVCNDCQETFIAIIG